MAYRNPNSKYSRRKARREAAEHYESLSPEEKTEWNMSGCLVMIVIMVIVFLILGPEGFKKWMQR